MSKFSCCCGLFLMVYGLLPLFFFYFEVKDDFGWLLDFETAPAGTEQPQDLKFPDSAPDGLEGCMQDFAKLGANGPSSQRDVKVATKTVSSRFWGSGKSKGEIQAKVLLQDELPNCEKLYTKYSRRFAVVGMGDILPTAQQVMEGVLWGANEGKSGEQVLEKLGVASSKFYAQVALVYWKSGINTMHAGWFYVLPVVLGWCGFFLACYSCCCASKKHTEQSGSSNQSESASVDEERNPFLNHFAAPAKPAPCTHAATPPMTGPASSSSSSDDDSSDEEDK